MTNLQTTLTAPDIAHRVAMETKKVMTNYLSSHTDWPHIDTDELDVITVPGDNLQFGVMHKKKTLGTLKVDIVKDKVSVSFSPGKIVFTF